MPLPKIQQHPCGTGTVLPSGTVNVTASCVAVVVDDSEVSVGAAAGAPKATAAKSAMAR